MSMPELWCLCDEGLPEKRYGSLTESEVWELHDLIHSQPEGTA